MTLVNYVDNNSVSRVTYENIKEIFQTIGLADRFVDDSFVTDYGLVTDENSHFGYYFSVEDVDDSLTMDWSKFTRPAYNVFDHHLEAEESGIDRDVVVFEDSDGEQSLISSLYVKITERLFDINIRNNPENVLMTGSREWPIRINCPKNHVDDFIIIAPICHVTYPVEQ